MSISVSRVTKRNIKDLAWIIGFVLVIIFVASVSTAHAQFCQDPGGEYIGGVYFPNARPGFDPGGYPVCGPADYAQVYGRQTSRWFDQFGMLGWYPMVGAPHGGVWGHPVQSGYQPVLDACQRPLSGRQRIERVAGITVLGGAIGVATGGQRGGWIGTAVGAAAAAINDSRYRGAPSDCRGSERIPISPQPYPPGYDPSGMSANPPYQQGGPTPVTVSRRSRQPEVEIKNPFRYDVEVSYSDNPDVVVGVIRRNSTRRFVWPSEGDGFVGRFRKPRNGGGWTYEEVAVNADGARYVLDPPED